VVEADEFKSLLLANVKVSDVNELVRLFTLTRQDCVIRSNERLDFSVPMPFTQTKQARTVYPLYLAVATGSLPVVRFLLKELTDLDLEKGLELRVKPALEHQYDKMIGVDHKGAQVLFKKRTPLQLACALGFYKIADQLLDAGANPNGLDQSLQPKNVSLPYL